MKRMLLPKEGTRFYKANLHAHTDLSDGTVTPEQVKEAYKAEGYSIVAYTDHEVLYDHSDLNDEDFLAVTSYEYAVSDGGNPFKFRKTCHLNLYSLDPHNTVQVCHHPDAPWFLKDEELKKSFKFVGEPYNRWYSPECINEVIRTANEHGFIVCYNHPQWSMETYEDWSRFEGMFAIEVYNTGSAVVEGFFEHNFQIYDNLLRMGKKVYPIAADDSHHLRGKDHPLCENFGGFCMIAAEKLGYGDVMESLQKGDFYASTGQLINEVSVEDDGTVTVRFPAAKEVLFRTACRHGLTVRGWAGQPIEEASFKVAPDDGFVYITVIGNDGRWAVTRAFYTDEIFTQSPKGE